MTNPFLAEILEQPEALRRCGDQFPADNTDLIRLRQQLEDRKFRHIILTGMGSSLYGCYPLWLTLSQQISVPVTIWDTAELLHHAPETLRPDTVVIAVSQSGESIELVHLTQLELQPGLFISVTNGTGNTLARHADIALYTHAGAEATVSTKTYTVGMAALHLLGCALTGQNVGTAKNDLHQLADGIEQFLAGRDEKIEFMRAILGDSQALAYMGRGYSMATVNTAALITEESSKLFCMGLSAAQFRHGPIELARAGFRAVIFAGDDRTKTRALNVQLAHKIGGYGGRCLLITSKPAAQADGVEVLTIPDAAAPILPIAEIIPIQLLTIPLAAAGGFEAAAFERIGKITDSE
jgi:glucosamine--fructose-6-phosphate aminotransferase (isomerizing)